MGRTVLVWWVWIFFVVVLLGPGRSCVEKMGVSKNRGTPKWIILENPIKMDDLGVPLFSETSIWRFTKHFYRNGL